jgi:hypothetical protein
MLQSGELDADSGGTHPHVLLLLGLLLRRFLLLILGRLQ